MKQCLSTGRVNRVGTVLFAAETFIKLIRLSSTVSADADEAYLALLTKN